MASPVGWVLVGVFIVLELCSDLIYFFISLLFNKYSSTLSMFYLCVPFYFAILVGSAVQDCAGSAVQS